MKAFALPGEAEGTKGAMHMCLFDETASVSFRLLQQVGRVRSCGVFSGVFISLRDGPQGKAGVSLFCVFLSVSDIDFFFFGGVTSFCLYFESGRMEDRDVRGC